MRMSMTMDGWAEPTAWFSLFTACSGVITCRESRLYVEGRVAGGKTKAPADVGG